MTQAIPQGFHTVTPTLMVKGAKEAIELYKKAFGATVDYVMEVPGQKDKVMHASIQIGNSKVFLGDHNPEMCAGAAPTNVNLYLYLEDVDAAYAKATDAGLEGKMEPADMFWGDRLGNVVDKFGISWSLCTHIRDVSEDELKKGAEDMMKQMQNKAA